MTTSLIYTAELMLLALILLGIYRMAHAISIESNRNNIASIGQSEPGNSGAPVSESSLQDTRTKPQVQADKHPEEQPKAICKQTLLNNYIGDFF